MIAIGLDCVLKGIDSGFDSGFEGRLVDQFHLAVLGYQPQKSVWQLRLEAFTAISREGLTAISQDGFKAITIVTYPSCRGSSPFIKVENVLKG